MFLSCYSYVHADKLVEFNLTDVFELFNISETLVYKKLDNRNFGEDLSSKKS